MKMMKYIQTWLLITLLALSASGGVNAKLASGGINLNSGMHQGINVANVLNALGINDVSRMLTSGSPLATKGLLNPQTIRFTQDSIKGTFKDGRSVTGLIDALKSGAVKASDLPAIRTFTRDGQLFSLDNRRLFAFQQAGVKIRTVPATASEIANEAFKFTSKNGGTSIRVRGGGG